MNRRQTAKAQPAPVFPGSRWRHAATNKAETQLDPRAIEVLRAEIGHDFDRGNDPYNHTGPQVLLSLLRDSEKR